MKIEQLIDGLQKGLDLVETYAPVSQGLGLPVVSNVAAIASSVSSIAQNLLERIEDGRVAASSNDQDAIRAIAEKIGRENDRLAQIIASS